ncbi:MBL fold metallo-hydrolase [Pelagibacterium luteolum]|uniref:Glyoxylase, beta-lactamase superfamily II n=1 Tax=Pelagibacterium luteolum TaxID=440168 RepID=A0A1G7TUJ0_9HYPH|nr:MBL fold metallo-hydrolase [Pelagibacterium luteolum]SDG38831.1 Glyoxylase, beta-lactamase superfamily II [Pelagibacterium luteolum]
MPASTPAPAYSTSFDPQTGVAVPVSPGIVRVTAPNVGAYTFTGTNTYIVGERAVAVIDPGPDDEAHLTALTHAIAGRRVEAVVLTHTHRDHCGLARKLMATTGAPLWSNGPHRLSRPLKPFEFNPFGRAGDFRLMPDRVIVDGERLEFDGIGLEVVATPGHCANHLAFAIAGRPELIVGDHVMGWNSTLIATPDGDLRDYFASLDRVIGLEQSLYLPGHGGAIADGREHARALKAHRSMRNGQLLAVLEGGPKSLRQAALAVYPGLKGRLLLAAGRTLLAHAEYLERQGRVVVRRTLLGIRLSLV